MRSTNAILDLSVLERAAADGFSTPADLNRVFGYNVWRRVAPWARSFRAGVIVVYQTQDQCEILMVAQRAAEFIGRRGRECLPERLGFPKGKAEPTDPSALFTAARELREETGIDIFSEDIDAKIAQGVFAFPRSEAGIEEIHIYFMVFVTRKPAVVTCPRELAGYKWINPQISLRSISPVTIPTKCLLKHLDDFDFRAPQILIGLAQSHQIHTLSP